MSALRKEREDARANVFVGVEPGPALMRINGRVRPARDWCEMFGHALNVEGFCEVCEGRRSFPRPKGAA